MAKTPLLHQMKNKSKSRKMERLAFFNSQFCFQENNFTRNNMKCNYYSKNNTNKKLLFLKL